MIIKKRDSSVHPLPKNREPFFGKDGIDEDGHYDETKDRTFLKRLKREYPEAYEELMKLLKDDKK